MADIVRYSVNELMKDESYNTFLYVLSHKKEFEIFEKKMKNALLEEMEKNGVTFFENDNIKVQYKSPSIRKTVDTEKLKEQGLYEDFVKETQVSASVSITLK